MTTKFTENFKLGGGCKTENVEKKITYNAVNEQHPPPLSQQQQQQQQPSQAIFELYFDIAHPTAPLINKTLKVIGPFISVFVCLEMMPICLFMRLSHSPPQAQQ